MTKPNIVVFMTDQQTPFLRKSQGYSLDPTPFLDGLARGGVDFRQAYTSSPICVAARVSFFTGRFPSASRVKSNYNQSDAIYSKDLLDVLHEQGYEFWYAGKNHSHMTEERMDRVFAIGHGGGSGPDRTEQEQQFDTFLRGLRHRTLREPTPFPLECQGPYRVISKAQQWIDEQGDNPFFLWLSFAEPHNPYQVPEPYCSMFSPDSLPPLGADKRSLAGKSFPWQFVRSVWERAIEDFDEEVLRARSNYHGMLRLIDDQVRRFVEFLDQRGLTDNTLLVFLSDHGDFVGEYGLLRKGPEMPERLMRIPLIMKGPGISQGIVYEHLFVSIVDLMPTFCELLGAAIPMGVQGRSLLPLLQGDAIPEKEFDSIYAEQGFGGLFYDENEPLTPEAEGVFNDGCTVDELNSWTQSGTMRMIRKGDWKLVFDSRGCGQLYDLAKDPMELTNLFDHLRCASVQKDLLETLLTWILRMQDVLPVPQRRYQVKRGRHNYYTVDEVK